MAESEWLFSGAATAYIFILLYIIKKKGKLMNEILEPSEEKNQVFIHNNFR